MRIIISGYLLRDVFGKRGNRFLPGRGSFFFIIILSVKRKEHAVNHSILSSYFPSIYSYYLIFSFDLCLL